MSSSAGMGGVIPRTEENAPDMIRIPEHRLAVIRTKRHSTLSQKDDPGTTNVVGRWNVAGQDDSTAHTEYQAAAYLYDFFIPITHSLTVF
jgi:hypothetical protein